MKQNANKSGARPRRVNVLLTLGLLAAAIAGIVIHLQRGDSKNGQQDIPLFTVAQGRLTISVTEAGAIKPSEQEIIKSEIEGRTTILYLIPEGTRVKQGELLVELDASQLQDSKIDQEIRVQNAEASFIQSRENLGVVKNQAQSDVDKAELALRFALEDLTQYKQGEFPNALKEYEARITLAKEEFQRVEEKLKWSRVLFDETYLSESELRADELAVKRSALDVELAQNNLNLLNEFTYKRKIAELESNEKQTKMALEREQRKASANGVQAEADLRAKESEFKQQTDKLNKLSEQIAKAQIIAPRDGMVVYATSAKASWRGNTEPLDEGQEVREREELIYLPTASIFIAETKIHESNLDKIGIDMAARITVDALPGEEFRGKVSKIAPLPDARSMFMNPELKLYNTEVTLEGGADVLRTGMSCQVEILVETYDSAVFVPVQSVVRIQGVPTVFVLSRDGIEQRPVKIGLDNNRMVHVLDGLAKDERVLMAPPLDKAGVSDSDEGDDAQDKTSETSGKKVEPTMSTSAPSSSGASGGKRGSMSPADRQKMRERLEKMTPEEREAARARFQQGAQPAQTGRRGEQ